MHASRFSLALIFGCLSLSLSATASAVAVAPVDITSLFNTGVDASGNALVGGDGVVDPHYIVLSSTIGGVVTGVNAVTYKHPSYVADDATSRWVSHSSSGFPGSGTTTFRTTFDLTGLDPNTALITGLNSADNGGVIVVNGQTTGISLNGNFGTLVAFSITSGFIAGLNTLDFVVDDFGPPMALRVASLSGTAQLAAVPVPASLLMLAPAVLGLGVLRRKRA